MKKIYVADVTLGVAAKHLPAMLGFKEKLEIARNLDKMGIDIIELSTIEDPKTDALLIRTISSFIKNGTVSIEVGSTEESVDAAWAAVSGAARSRLKVALPVSPALMEYNCHQKPAQVIETIKKLVSKCASLASDVEFAAVDATRAESDFLKSAVEAAISSGATVVTVCDSEGNRMPAETDAFIKSIYANIPAAGKVRLGYLCENNYGMGLSSLITATVCGVEEVKISVGTTLYSAFDKFSEMLKNRGDSLGLATSLSRTELARTASQIAWIASEKNSGISTLGSAAAEHTQISGSFTKADDIKSISKAVKKLGYDLSEDDKDKVYEAFMRVANKKKEVSPKELDAIVASTALQVPPAYKLVTYLITSSNAVTASANIMLERNGEKMQGVSLGDGPVDAAFLAVEQITGRRFELDDFQISAVTEGREAVGSAIVKLRENGKLYPGQGISTDIVGAAVHAYLSAVNKIIYEEENR